MSINMANVKSITLGGVEVKKIEDTSGRILWGGSTTATINITVGASQDITTTQYYNRIVLPSLSSIKSKVASKIGSSSSGINVTKVELYLGTLYWYSDYASKDTPYLSLSTSNPDYFGGGRRRSQSGIYNWDTYKIDVTDYLGKSLYGYRINNDGFYEFNNSSSSGSRFCTSSSSSTLPTFTLIVTYEY